MVIPQKNQRHILKYYHLYILHTGLYRIDAMILQNVYWVIKYNPSKSKSAIVTPTKIKLVK